MKDNQKNEVVISPGAKQEHLVRSVVIAKILDVNKKTVENWAAAGRIPSHKWAGTLRFNLKDVFSALGVQR